MEYARGDGCGERALTGLDLTGGRSLSSEERHGERHGSRQEWQSARFDAQLDLASAIDQQLVVGNVMAQVKDDVYVIGILIANKATRVFLSKLVGTGAGYLAKEGETDANEKMLVPHHIYQATQQREEFDFLTNRYMGR